MSGPILLIASQTCTETEQTVKLLLSELSTLRLEKCEKYPQGCVF